MTRRASGLQKVSQKEIEEKSHSDWLARFNWKMAICPYVSIVSAASVRSYCLTVICLSVCEQVNSKSYGWIFGEFFFKRYTVDQRKREQILEGYCERLRLVIKVSLWVVELFEK